MNEAICNTSPLLYLYRIGAIDWLPKLFSGVWAPSAVAEELHEGRKRRYDVPNPVNYEWLGIVDPASMPSEWPALDLGAGESSAMALALENPSRILLLDDALARRTAQAAGPTVWGTLRVLLEAKSAGLTAEIAPLIPRVQQAGLWMSEEIKQRILAIAGEMTEQ